MSRTCDISGVGVLSGNNVSHSNRRTRRKFLPNLQSVTLSSDILGQSFQMRIAVKTLRSVEAKGGFDEYLLSKPTRDLTAKAASIRAQIKKHVTKNNDKVS